MAADGESIMGRVHGGMNSPMAWILSRSATTATTSTSGPPERFTPSSRRCIQTSSHRKSPSANFLHREIWSEPSIRWSTTQATDSRLRLVVSAWHDHEYIVEETMEGL